MTSLHSRWSSWPTFCTLSSKHSLTFLPLPGLSARPRLSFVYWCWHGGISAGLTCSLHSLLSDKNYATILLCWINSFYRAPIIKTAVNADNMIRCRMLWVIPWKPATIAKDVSCWSRVLSQSELSHSFLFWHAKWWENHPWLCSTGKLSFRVFLIPWKHSW